MTSAARASPRLTLFGNAAVEASVAQGAPQPFVSERLFQLAAFLAARRAWVSRDQLTALLWPELPADAARRNLRKLIFRAQRQPWFGGEVRADALRWEVESDLSAFEGAVARSDWAGAVESYGGVLLAGMEHAASSAFADGLGFERTRLAAVFRDAAARCCAELRGDAVARANVASAWLRHDPFDEDALVILVEALRAGGRMAEAERAQQQFVARLRETLEVAPSARVLELAVAPVAAPAAAPVPATHTAATDLIGRRAEMQTLAGLLERPECRLLTIVGPGGIGKSRLARVAATRVAQRYADGVHWTDLEDLANVTQLAWRIASVLGTDIAGAADPVGRLLDALRTRCALLILDNSEHLADLPAFAARVLTTCLEVQLLTTSRARLEVTGEWLLPLAGLPVPDEDETEIDALRAFDSVRLFEQRALAAAPNFDAAGHAEEIARLVRLVEGMPLAIELAAAWVRLLPVQEIRAEIARSLDLLARDTPGLPDRQKSVRASFAHSWQLLSAREQEALARLSIFAGPFTRAAAAQVAQAELPVLAGLVDRSLLRADGAGRFSFHALMHQCAREKLESDAARAQEQAQRHAEFFTQLLAKFVGGATGKKAIMDEIEGSLADCRSAWKWLACHTAQSEAVARLDTMIEPLIRFFEVKGRFDDGLALLDAAQEGFAASSDSSKVPGAMLAWRAVLLSHKGQTQAALEIALLGLERAREARRSDVMRLCHQLIGYAWWQQGANRVARRAFEKALELADRLGNETAIAAALQGVAGCARSGGDFAAAIAAYQRSLALYRERGNVQGEAIALENLASVQRSRRDFASARSYSEACLRLAEEHQLTTVRVYALLGLGLIEIELGQFDAARDHLVQARAADRVVGAGIVAPEIPLALGRLNLRTGQAEAALPLLREGLAMGQVRLEEPSQLGAVGCFAEYHALYGERALAAAYWTFVAAHPATDALDRDDAERGLAGLNLSAEATAQAQAAARELTLLTICDRLLDGT